VANVLSAADIVEVTLLGKCFEQDIQNKFHYAVTEVSGAPQSSLTSFTALDADLIAGGGLLNLMLLLAPEDYHLTGVRYQVISPVRQVSYPIVHTQDGLNTCNTAMCNIAFAITKRGDLAGRRNISTTHVIGTSDPSLAQFGKITPAALALAENIAAFMDNAVEFTVGGVDYTLNPVIFHPTDPLNPTPITSCIVQPTTRVMRRRTVGIGS